MRVSDNNYVMDESSSKNGFVSFSEIIKISDTRIFVFVFSRLANGHSDREKNEHFVQHPRNLN